MTRTEELMNLAEVATPGPWHADGERDDNDCVCCKELYIVSDGAVEDVNFIAEANPETIKQLIKLVRLQHEALKEALEYVEYNGPDDEVGGHCCCNSLSYKPHEPDCAVNNAIAAFNKFEGGE